MTDLQRVELVMRDLKQQEENYQRKQNELQNYEHEMKILQDRRSGNDNAQSEEDKLKLMQEELAEL